MPQIDGNFCDEMLYAGLVLLYFFDDNDTEDFVLLSSTWSYLNWYYQEKISKLPLEGQFFAKVATLKK